MRRQPQITHASKPTRFQSTHPSGVRPSAGMVFSAAARFQSTHPSGVRRRTQPMTSMHAYFNPRTPVGCDLDAAREPFAFRHISIHAPQWGATRYRLGPDVDPPDFNPRTPVGCDLGYLGIQSSGTISIHAPQWGATTRGKPNNPRDNYFNPRTPVGCDDGKNAHHHCQGFQSTHPSGVRRRTTSINTVRR